MSRITQDLQCLVDVTKEYAPSNGGATISVTRLEDVVDYLQRLEDVVKKTENLLKYTQWGHVTPGETWTEDQTDMLAYLRDASVRAGR